ncbi:MAG: hypothetical protein NT133_15420 [Alphaproteobacteria bacterium]|nr:hypothetical protein [Alphaproteobacteria bacterium]
MDEPYVIGVRLALEDGVSAGMARMSETMKATSAMLAGLGPLPHAGGQGPAAALIGQARARGTAPPPRPPPSRYRRGRLPRPSG